VEILATVEAPVLDLGCGPGRHLAALRAVGKRGLGVDLSPVAVRLARGRGAEVINGSLWSQVPRAGTWRTILLLDGNIGIGGAPVLLLRRSGELLAEGGAIVVEVDPAGAPTHGVRVRLEAPGVVSEWFRWARVGLDGVAGVAAQAGFVVAETRTLAGRTFVTLRRAT
jgi:SAM-dependent methyltransferase